MNKADFFCVLLTTVVAVEAYSGKWTWSISRYQDDFTVLHHAGVGFMALMMGWAGSLR